MATVSLFPAGPSMNVYRLQITRKMDEAFTLETIFWEHPKPRTTGYNRHITQFVQDTKPIKGPPSMAAPTCCEVPFVEERRWLFQKTHPEWFVPDLGGLCHFDIELRPVSELSIRRRFGSLNDLRYALNYKECRFKGNILCTEFL